MGEHVSRSAPDDLVRRRLLHIRHCVFFVADKMSVDSRSICIIWAACWIPLWILPSSYGGLVAGAFLIQMGVQGTWGVVS